MPTPHAARRPAVVCVGHATLDAIVAVPRLPASDERVPASSGLLAGGGPAATAAVTLARLGVPVAFAGYVGDDRAGRLIRDGLADEGVDVSLLERAPGRSPITAVLLDPAGGRALVPAPRDVPPPALSRRLAALLTNETWLHVDHVGAVLLPAVRDARLAPRISVDGGNAIPGLSLSTVELYAPTVAALLERTRHRDIDAALEAVLAEGARLVVATRGAGGAVAAWIDPDGRRQRLDAPAADVASVVSTLGAGDVFHGALLAALVEARPVADAVARANAVAGASTRALDARSAIPGRGELEAMLLAGALP